MLRRSLLVKAGLYIVLAVLAIGFLLPLIWGIASSFRPLNEIFKYAMPITWRTFVPTSPTLNNYIELFRQVGSTHHVSIPYGLSLVNSLFIAFTTVVAGLFVNSLAGLAFAKFDFPAKNILFLLVLLSFMIPFEVIVIPLYLLIGSWNLTNTYFALILPAITNGLAIFLFRQFFIGIPSSLIDSAKIDGASWFRIYLYIILPMSKPVMVCISVMLFLVQWDAFFWPLVAATDENMTVVQVAISRLWGQYSVEWHLILAGSMLASAVPAIIFIILQRYYVRGVALSGLKA